MLTADRLMAHLIALTPWPVRIIANESSVSSFFPTDAHTWCIFPLSSIASYCSVLFLQQTAGTSSWVFSSGFIFILFHFYELIIDIIRGHKHACVKTSLHLTFLGVVMCACSD